jgi:ABC-type nitrate/sulfonate/bicarbonate transport system substrate-binding protein
MKPLFLKIIILACLIQTVCGADLEKVNVGYFKSLITIAPVVIKENGWDKEMGLEFDLHYFNGPPLVVQAFAANKVDLMYNNPTSVFPLPERGVPIKILSATTINSFLVIAHPPLAVLQQKGKVSASDAIKAFVAQQKRKVKLGIIAKGAITDILVHLWLEKQPKEIADDIEIVNAGAFDQLQQLVAAGALDAACLPEPLFAIARDHDPAWQIFIKPEELLPDHLSGVLVAHQAFVDNHPDIVKKLIVLQIRATQFLREHPKEAAECIVRQPAEGMVKADVWEQAIRTAQSTFSTDLQSTLPSSQIMWDYMKRNAYLNSDFNPDQIFALTAYNEAGARK